MKGSFKVKSALQRINVLQQPQIAASEAERVHVFYAWKILAKI